MILCLQIYGETDMGRYYGLDLRRRVVDAIDGGMSARAAAGRFSIGISTAINWHRRWREEGALEPRPQGQPRGSKLDAHEAFILGLVDENKDIALHEIAERLKAERDVCTCPATVWYFFSRRGWTHKKRQRMPLSSSARTSSPGAKTGSKAKRTSIRNG